MARRLVWMWLQCSGRVELVLAVVLGPDGEQEAGCRADGLAPYAGLAEALGLRFAVPASAVLPALEQLPPTGCAPSVCQVASALLPVLVEAGAGFRV